MDTKHTPGPWAVQSQRTNEPMWILGPEPDNLSVSRSIFVAKLGSAMGFQDANPQETLANARLIAAAPMLLGACRSAVSSLSIFEATKISYFADLAKEYLLAAIAAAEKGE